MIWDVKLGDSSQVHFFGDPGMEMMLECRGWMCLNHNKTDGFRRILSPIQRFGVGDVILGVILTLFGDLRVTFMIF